MTIKMEVMLVTLLLPRSTHAYIGGLGVYAVIRDVSCQSKVSHLCNIVVANENISRCQVSMNALMRKISSMLQEILITRKKRKEKNNNNNNNNNNNKNRTKQNKTKAV